MEARHLRGARAPGPASRCPDAELQKVKNQAKANAYRRLSSPFFIHLQLMYYDGLGRLAVHQHLRRRGGPRDRGRPPARGPRDLHQGEPDGGRLPAQGGGGGAGGRERAMPATMMAAALALAQAAVPAAAQIPDHPDKLAFQPIAYTPPPRATTAWCSRTGWWSSSPRTRRCPWSNISLIVRTGGYLEPAGKDGPGRAHRVADPRAAAARPSPRSSSTSGSTSWPPTSPPASATPAGTAIAQLPAPTTSTSRCACSSEMLKQPRFQEDRLAPGQGAGPSRR